MSTLQERVVECMSRHPALSQADIARACRVKTPSVAGWLSGRTKTLKAETARLAAQLFNCDQNWLALGLGQANWGTRTATTDPLTLRRLDDALINGRLVGEPSPPLRAHHLSHRLHRLPPTIPWEALVTATTLPHEFRTALVDDAMSPRAPRGTVIEFRLAERAHPGQAVLLIDEHSHVHMRELHSRPDGRLVGRPTNDAYHTIEIVGEVRLLAVMIGILAGWEQLRS